MVYDGGMRVLTLCVCGHDEHEAECGCGCMIFEPDNDDSWGSPDMVTAYRHRRDSPTPTLRDGRKI